MSLLSLLGQPINLQTLGEGWGLVMEDCLPGRQEGTWRPALDGVQLGSSPGTSLLCLRLPQPGRKQSGTLLHHKSVCPALTTDTSESKDLAQEYWCICSSPRFSSPGSSCYLAPTRTTTHVSARTHTKQLGTEVFLYR